MPTTTKDRSNDRLLLLEEVADLLRMSIKTLRFQRSQTPHKVPFLFSRSNRVVAWESDVYEWLDKLQQREKQERLDAEQQRIDDERNS